MIRLKWGNIGPSSAARLALISSFARMATCLFSFLKQWLGGNIQRNFQENRSMTSISEDSPYVRSMSTVILVETLHSKDKLN